MERSDKSVEELFGMYAPELVAYLQCEDPFWSRIKNNSLTDEELEQHQGLIEELGMSPESSDVAKAIMIIKRLRQTVLPTPTNLGAAPTD